MKVYIVQERLWEQEDDYFVLADIVPLKAFENREDAVAFHLLLMLSGSSALANTRLPYLGEAGPRDPGGYPLFEIAEAELYL